MSEGASTGSSPRRIRLANAVAALRHLHQDGPLSRADLARRLGLNRSSSGQIVAELAASGLLREGSGPEPEARGAGRPGILLELVPEAASFIGIEIGVEHISAVCIDLAGQTLTERKIAFQTPDTNAEVAVRAAVDLAIGGLDASMMAQCRGVGVAAPMHIRPDGTVAIAPLIGWRDLDLAGLVAAALPHRLPIRIENDANAFAIGDSYRRGPSGVTLFLLMETGVGGGILIDGKLFRGGHGLAGEVGHMLVPGSGKASLEQLIGREALVTRFRHDSGMAGADLPDFLSSVHDRDPVAVTIAEDWSRHLGFTLAQACRMIDPDRIVLGGSVAALYPLVSARVRAHMTLPQVVDFPVPPIVVDANAEVGAAYGAACLMHQRFLSLDNDQLLTEEAPG